MADERISGVRAADYDFGLAFCKSWFGHQSDVLGVGVGAAYYKVNFRGTAYAGDPSDSTSADCEDSEWTPMLMRGRPHAFDDPWCMYSDVASVKKNGGDLSKHTWNASLGTG